MTFAVISSPKCKWCTKAMDLLESKGLDYEVKSVATRPWLKTLMASSGLTTVPQIFRPDGELIGGYEALKSYLGDA